MKYICEVCNQQFNTADEARNCEYTHNAEAKKKQLIEKAKASASEKISDAINAYIERYKELPEIELSPENQNIFTVDGISISLRHIIANEVLSMITDILFEEEDDGEDTCCECEDCSTNCRNYNEE